MTAPKFLLVRIPWQSVSVAEVRYRRRILASINPRNAGPWAISSKMR